jgi:hypothetical protein
VRVEVGFGEGRKRRKEEREGREGRKRGKEEREGREGGNVYLLEVECVLEVTGTGLR